MKPSTIAAVLPALRLLIDAGDAVVELAARFGLSDLAATRTVGGWELDAELSIRRLGVGVLVNHEPARAPLHGDLTTLGLLAGPLRLSAVRARLAAERLDCALGAALDDDVPLAYSEGEEIMLGLRDPGPLPSLEELRLMDAHVADEIARRGGETS